MRKQNKTMFSVLELLIVMTIMAILALMIFVIIKGAKDSARMVLTESTLKTCKSSMENVYNFIFNEARKNNIEVYQHPFFSKVFPSNRAWTFCDKDYSDIGIEANGLMNMINIGNLGVENKSMATQYIEYPGEATPLKTLVDGWGNPILLIRNELPWWIKKMKPNDNLIESVYRDRSKSNLGLYAFHLFETDTSNKNFYEWNDGTNGFDHIDSKGVKEPSYEVAPEQKSGFRKLGKELYGKIAVPYNTNDFDFFSVGKDGKIGNLIPQDMKQDRYSKKVKVNKNDITSPLSVVWTPASASNVDPDDDNIISFNRYNLEK